MWGIRKYQDGNRIDTLGTMTVEIPAKGRLCLPYSIHHFLVLSPGNSQGQRSLLGCSPWGRKESDTTEPLHFHELEKEMATHSSVLARRIPGTA